MGGKPDLWWSDQIGHYAGKTLKWGLSGAGGALGFVVGAGTGIPTGPGAIATGVGGAGIGAAAGWGAAEGMIYGIDRGMKSLADWIEGTPARMRRERLRWDAMSRMPPTPRLQPKVEQGTQIDEHTVYWPKRKHTDFTKPFVIETKIPRQRPFTRINTPFVIETKNPHKPFGGSSRPTLFQQLNQQLQRLDAGPSSSFKPLRLFDADSRRRLGLSNLTFGGFGGSFSTVPSLSRSGGGSLSSLWDSGSSFRSSAGSSSFKPFRLFDAGSRERLGLSNLTFGGSGGSFSTVPSLSRSGGGSLSNLWNAGSGFSSASAGPPSIRLSTSPKLNFNTPAWQGVGGGPSLSSFARGL